MRVSRWEECGFSRNRQNPFSAQRFAPGCLPFQFPESQSVDALVRRWEQSGRLGEIVGPHGSGKSTLLSEIIPVLEEEGRRVLLIELHQGAATIPFSDDAIRRVTAAHDLLVDGYEQLSFTSRIRLRWFVRRRRCGLLVTTHQSVGFPPVHHTRTDIALAKALVARLTSAKWSEAFSREIERAFEKHVGNLREVFFELYDRVEDERQSPCVTMEGGTATPENQ